jgi:hypothetical protein
LICGFRCEVGAIDKCVIDATGRNGDRAHKSGRAASRSIRRITPAPACERGEVGGSHVWIAEMIRDRTPLALRAAPAGFRAIASRATTEVGISSGSIQFNRRHSGHPRRKPSFAQRDRATPPSA